MRPPPRLNLKTAHTALKKLGRSSTLTFQQKSTHSGHRACLTEQLHKARPSPFQSIRLNRYDILS